MTCRAVIVDGEPCVVISIDEYEKLRELAAGTPLPELPKANRYGNTPALPFVRASMARDVILERLSLGMTRSELARMARVRIASITKAESGEHSIAPLVMKKIDAALRRARRARLRAGGLAHESR